MKSCRPEFQAGEKPILLALDWKRLVVLRFCLDLLRLPVSFVSETFWAAASAHVTKDHVDHVMEVDSQLGRV